MKDFSALAAKAVSESNIDMTKAQVGGGEDFAPPPAGPCGLRLVGYFEIGKHAGTYLGKPTNKEYVQLVFEVLGKNYPAVELPDGTKMPIRVTVEETFSLSDKGRFFALCQRLLYAGDQQHVVGCMGRAYKGRIIHRKYAKRGEPKDDPSKHTGIAVELYDRKLKTWTIEAPRYEVVDQETGEATGEFKAVVVPPALTAPKAFLWNHSDKEDWDSLFIEGEYPERKNEKGEVTAPAKSKNVIQNKIRSATNFKTSPIYGILAAAGVDLNAALDPTDAPEDDDHSAPPAEQPAPANMTPAQEDDALNGVV